MILFFKASLLDVVFRQDYFWQRTLSTNYSFDLCLKQHISKTKDLPYQCDF